MQKTAVGDSLIWRLVREAELSEECKVLRPERSEAALICTGELFAILFGMVFWRNPVLTSDLSV